MRQTRVSSICLPQWRRIQVTPTGRLDGRVARSRALRYISLMKAYVHARLSKEERGILDELRKMTGQSESELLRRGLRLVFQEQIPGRSALELAGGSAGKFKKGPKDLSTNKKHLDGFGK